jgi:hypothetical protein
LHAEARKAEAKKTCNASCKKAKAHRDEANSRVEAAEQTLLIAETKATSESPLKAPLWLLPAALDLVAFMAIWTGLAGPKPQPKAPRKRTRRTAKAKRKGKPLMPVHPTDLDHLNRLKVIK